jgi:hypothetical protein
MQMNATGSSLQLPISDKCLQRTPGDEAAVSAALLQPISGGSEVIAEYEADLASFWERRRSSVTPTPITSA